MPGDLKHRIGDRVIHAFDVVCLVRKIRGVRNLRAQSSRRFIHALASGAHTFGGREVEARERYRL
jgi:hypothetical protein